MEGIPSDQVQSLTAERLWQAALSELSRQLLKATYRTWLADTQAIASTPGSLTIAVCSRQAQEWLTYQLHPPIVRTVSNLAGRHTAVRFVIAGKEERMNGLENRLEEHLAEWDSWLAEATPSTPSTRFDVTDEISPTGESNPMQNQPEPAAPQRIRIYSHVTQSTFFHVEDALSINKLRLFAGTYRRGQGSRQHGFYFLSIEDARVIFTALVHPRSGVSHKEYKGSVKEQPDGRKEVTSRVLSVQVKEDRVYFEFKNGPGKLTNTGAIQPDGKAAVELTVPFKHYEAQRLALTVLAHLQAWDVVRLLTHRQSASPFPAYELAPAAENDEKVSKEATPAANRPVSMASPPVRPGNGNSIGQPAKKGGAASQPKSAPAQKGQRNRNHPKTGARIESK
jgi:hypothetical protein